MTGVISRIKWSYNPYINGRKKWITGVLTFITLLNERPNDRLNPGVFKISSSLTEKMPFGPPKPINQTAVTSYLPGCLGNLKKRFRQNLGRTPPGPTVDQLQGAGKFGDSRCAKPRTMGLVGIFTYGFDIKIKQGII